MWCVRNKQIYKVEIIKPSNRGTGFWCKIENFKKAKLISASKLFLIKEEALNSL